MIARLSLRSNHYLPLLAILLSGSATLAAEPRYASLYDFQGGSDGGNPISFLIADKAGNLYGTTYAGGSGTFCLGGCGTVFQLRPPSEKGSPWTETVLYSFAGNPDGYYPSSGHLLFDSFGNLYGATQFGGSAGFGYGTMYRLSPPAEPDGTWTETVLYNFTDGDDGGVPANGLVMDSVGNLYGTTNDGGAYGQEGVGTIFELSPPTEPGGAWTENTLFSFQQIKDGDEPNELTLDAKGNLYGTRSADTILCTPNNPRYCGTAFELKHDGSAWHMRVLHTFTGTNDGSSPSSGLIFDNQGTLYGTTVGYGGNTATTGTVFKLTPPSEDAESWTETLLYVFTGGADGSAPLSDVIFDDKGNLYSTTFYGGDMSCAVGLGCGVVFKLAPPAQQGSSWTESVLHAFGQGNDGQDPYAGLIRIEGQGLFGTTAAGGGSVSCNGGCGTAFEIIP
jgi:uncharacterized repeat protein (TIGR03803 family)